MNDVTHVPAWTNRLSEIKDDVAPLLQKMYSESCSLKTEDQYVLRELLSQYAAVVDLLNEAVAKPAPKKTLRQKLTGK